MPFDGQLQPWQRFADHVQQLKQALQDGDMIAVDSLLRDHRELVASLQGQPINDAVKEEALLASIHSQVTEILRMAEQRRQALRAYIVETGKQKEQIVAYTIASHLTA